MKKRGPHARFTRRRFGFLAASVALIALFAGSAARASAASLPSQGPAANFTLTSLKHDKIELSQFRGKVVLLNFWASWCGPCQIEMPEFVKWQREYGGEGLQVIGVSMDSSPKTAAAAAAKLKVNYPVVMGDVRLATAYHGVLGLPVTFLIDRKGDIRGRYEGVQLQRLKGNLLQLLSSK